MESALEAVSLHSAIDAPCLPTPPDTAESSTSTHDLPPFVRPADTLQEDGNSSTQQSEACTREDFSVNSSLAMYDCQKIASTAAIATAESETLSLQLEVRKLRHQLLVSQISAKQFKSECQLYKARINGGESLNKKKRKELHGPPPAARQALRGIENRLVSASATDPYSSQSRPAGTPAVNSSKGSQRFCPVAKMMRRAGESDAVKQQGGVESNAMRSVGIIDASDMFSCISLRSL